MKCINIDDRTNMYGEVCMYICSDRNETVQAFQQKQSINQRRSIPALKFNMLFSFLEDDWQEGGLWFWHVYPEHSFTLINQDLYEYQIAVVIVEWDVLKEGSRR